MGRGCPSNKLFEKLVLTITAICHACNHALTRNLPCNVMYGLDFVGDQGGTEADYMSDNTAAATARGQEGS